MQERPYLSIGEVLGLLLEEFPDVTISKIRFLESQGLIDPERTASGYRKFYDNDVDLLRVILREQRENFLPLRVIRDRLESGAIEDPTGPTTPPRASATSSPSTDPITDDDRRIEPAATSATDDASRIRRRQQPVSIARPVAGDPARRANTPMRFARTVDDETSSPASCASSPDSLQQQLAELESYGLLAGKGSGEATTYTAG